MGQYNIVPINSNSVTINAAITACVNFQNHTLYTLYYRSKKKEIETRLDDLYLLVSFAIFSVCVEWHLMIAMRNANCCRDDRIYPNICRWPTAGIEYSKVNNIKYFHKRFMQTWYMMISWISRWTIC